MPIEEVIEEAWIKLGFCKVKVTAGVGNKMYRPI
jgi:hypothetical protein